jgi:hypothetical protein
LAFPAGGERQALAMNEVDFSVERLRVKTRRCAFTTTGRGGLFEARLAAVLKHFDWRFSGMALVALGLQIKLAIVSRFKAGG